ncbi:hypothetical protein CLOSYM_03279 [[Clostridium] symbiosum ATCC 14940]|uniref:Uncharacterized protein n=1 Tax=[Clostridium] symbiosum ATCC 14940 TaxID=411472 RepID=A0ABC9TV71_CLOSY|nr:hypothetical protein CLOSYM_03279 [[Clostridium] symbiosum ATCC 14940]
MEKEILRFLFSQGGAGVNEIDSISFSRKVFAGAKDSYQL